jgi:uncharacterized protein
MEPSEFLIDGPPNASLTLGLAHGAGGPMDSPFLNAVASGVAAEGIRVARFEFPYMRARRTEGKHGAPDREPVLRQSWLEAIALLGGGSRLAIGGKSMGGRIASMVADEAGVRGLVCLGYPFHPPGQPKKLRTKHLETLRTAALTVQGSRDPFGTRDEVAGYALSAQIEIHWLEDGDHSWKPRASSGRTEAENRAEGIAAVCRFLKSI